MAEPDTTADPSADTQRDVTSMGAQAASPVAAPPLARPSASEIPLALPAQRGPSPSGSSRVAPPDGFLSGPPEPAARAGDAADTTAPAEPAARASDPRVAPATEPVAGRRSSAHMVAGSSSGTAAEGRPLAAYEALARSPKLGDLVAIAQRLISEMMARGTTGSPAADVTAAVAEAGLAHDDGDTPFGNVFDVLTGGRVSTSERALASALWAHAVAEAPRGRTERADAVAEESLWLATHTAFDATMLLDRALGEDASDLWNAVAGLVRRLQRDGRATPTGSARALGRAEAIVGAAALAASNAPGAKELTAQLARDAKDPVLLRVLAAVGTEPAEAARLEGELVPAPRGPIATTLLAFSGLLFAIHGVRLVARLALAYRSPAEVVFSDSGVRVKTRTEVLGRTLREREHVIPRAGLVRVVREVRFPRAAFYAGLLALAIGSYIGVRAFVDGVRSASPSLLLVGLVIVAVGVGVDFVLGTLVPGSRGRCRVAFVPRTGPTLCVGNVDVNRADAALLRSLGR